MRGYNESISPVETMNNPEHTVSKLDDRFVGPRQSRVGWIAGHAIRRGKGGLNVAQQNASAAHLVRRMFAQLDHAESAKVIKCLRISVDDRRSRQLPWSFGRYHGEIYGRVRKVELSLALSGFGVSMLMRPFFPRGLVRKAQRLGLLMFPVPR
jgi:hypothetical protein